MKPLHYGPHFSSSLTVYRRPDDLVSLIGCKGEGGITRKWRRKMRMKTCPPDSYSESMCPELCVCDSLLIQTSCWEQRLREETAHNDSLRRSITRRIVKPHTLLPLKLHQPVFLRKSISVTLKIISHFSFDSASRC